MESIMKIVIIGFMVIVAAVLLLPLVKSMQAMQPDPILMHEYTVLDLNTGKQMVAWADGNKISFKANDTAFKCDRELFKHRPQGNPSHKVLIVATYNQLYE